ncbi:hypothetical protein HDF15_001432 [Granulicella mallensis]|uniref:Uncharacterized protein n=1 Tax=Granulicella mallensis TaxID=940614 RepID=A0A7W8E8T9_9BACT|nr:hypothetical protein [Granulicella mallensis]
MIVNKVLAKLFVFKRSSSAFHGERYLRKRNHFHDFLLFKNPIMNFFVTMWEKEMNTKYGSLALEQVPASAVFSGKHH